MHTNGGDRWLVRDRLHDEIVNECRSQVKAREYAALLNTAADFFCNKPRYEMVRWDEHANRQTPS
jgi:hypothetical protein